MFRKIVSNLAFSPALVGQLSFYAKRLRKEEATRRIGLIFTALALIVQSFAVFTPPEAANAASSRDFIHGGISSIEEFLKAYDKNQGNLKDIFTYAGVTRNEIKNTKLTTWKVSDTTSWGRRPAVSASQGEVKHSIRDKNGNIVTTVYSHPQSTFFRKGARDYGWVGHSKKLGWFAISKGCANLVSKRLPTPPSKPTAVCAALTRTALSRTSFRLNASASLKNGASVSSYSFSVRDNRNKQVFTKTINTKNKSAQTNVNITTPGEYIANVTVKTSIGALSGGNCRTSLVVKELPVKNIQVCDLVRQKMVTIKENAFDNKKHSLDERDCQKPDPVYTCDGISVVKKSRNTLTFSTKYSSKNGAVYKTTIYTVTDAKGKQLYKGPNQSFTKKEAGTYFVQAEVVFSLDGVDKTTTDNTCKKSFTIEPEPPVSEKVCDLDSKKIITINTRDYDSKKHSRSLTDCSIAVTPPCPVNPDILSTSPDCQPCPGDSSLWVKDGECVAQIIEKKEALNLTTKKDATESTVKANDVIQYTITVRNEGKNEASADVVDELYDVLEYTTLTNGGTGTFDEEKKTLTWEVTSLAPGKELSFTYTVKMKDTIPAMATGASDGFSYDCRMVNTFGNTITLNVECPPSKAVENVVQQLPKTGPGANMITAGVVIAIVTYFYARSRQLSKEVRLIRRDLNSGTV